MGKFVLGIGNTLLRDEGIGCHVANALAEIPLPDVEIIDAGTCPDVWQFIEDTDKLIIVDAVKGGGMPGQIYRFHPEDVTLEQKPLLSMHDIGLVDNLVLMQLRQNIGETVIIGVEPKDINWGLELSAELQGKMSQIIDTVLSELNNTNPKGEMKC
ncbi:MAG: HyaD/HybD family hydrogenase maturation endopeptidase [Dehalococcoidia bacterium]|nr:HyaD/HybD family hydrogenase maturation endopeptidase [Dehalococcoidia bacterium]